MDQKLLARWHERVSMRQLSPAVAGVRELRVLGQALDDVIAFPQLRTASDIDALEADERAVLQYVSDVIDTYYRIGRGVFAVMRSTENGTYPEGQQLAHFDPTQAEDVIVLVQIAGG